MDSGQERILSLRQIKVEEICCQQICLVKNVKRNSLKSRKMKHVRNLDMHKERKGIRERISKVNKNHYF